MIVLVFTRIFVVCAIRVLSTGRDVATRNPNSGAELLHSSLAGQDTITLCARFNTFQFNLHNNLAEENFNMFLLTTVDASILSFAPMSPDYPGLRQHVPTKNWQNGNVFLFFGSWVRWRRLFIRWGPNEWNSICMKMSSSKELYEIYLNGKFLNIDISDYKGGHMASDSNIRLMGAKWKYMQSYESSNFGAMTDVNIWNQSLTELEVEQWSRCELGAGGNLLDWDTAQWEAVGLQEEELDKEIVCRLKKPTSQMFSFQKPMNMEMSVEFCSKIGGEIAVAGKQEEVQKLAKTIQNLGQKCRNDIKKPRTLHFSGHKNTRARMDLWQNVLTKTDLNFSNWEEGQPDNNGGSQHCIVLNSQNNKFYDYQCGADLCPVCRLPTGTRYQLQGVCSHSALDRYFILESTGSLLGYIQNQLDWSSAKLRYQLTNPKKFLYVI